MSARALIASCCVLASACAATSRSPRAPEALAVQARRLLETELSSGEPARVAAVLSELPLAGRAGWPLLERMPLSAEAAAERAIAALDPGRDLPELLRALASARQSRRITALRVLAHAEKSDALLAALSQTARADASSSVRAAAVRALAGQGSAAAAALLAALADPSEDVRRAACFAFPAADRERAVIALDAPLGAPASALGVDAAHAVLGAGLVPLQARAWALLAAALAAGDRAVRGRAASVWSTTTRGARDRALLRRRLAEEKAPEVRLLLAVALGARDAPARAALGSLSTLGSVTAVQAAAELARAGDPRAAGRLRRLSQHAAVRVRVVAARVLVGELGNTGEARRLLGDADAHVRIAAAVAVLRLAG